ncbi:MAG: orotidine-5'-phosphate decarboxylase [Parvularculaceae bacterium]|nr:orotidine-5'-phosphate decarboxylase [Parvularculaceae bacterium]
MNAEERLIVALDVPDVARAERIVAQLGPAGRFYKIGYQLIPIGGLDLGARLSAAGAKIFLDFKFHDIGATVERGTASVARRGADFLTVHAEEDVVKGAVAGKADDARLKILAVTVLTSLDQAALARAGISTPLPDLVLRRAEIAAEAGADGVVASAQEAAAIKARFGDRFLIVTPGVRPSGAAVHDQKRVVTPKDALRAGADYLVVGRPITDAEDPAAAARAIAAEMRGA